MGDGADDAFERVVDELIEDSYDLTWREEYHPRMPETKKICCYCGEKRLHWGWTVNNKWRLYNEEGRLHQCLFRLSK